MNFSIQEPFVLFVYEFQPETFRVSIGKINPQNFPAPKQQSNSASDLILFSQTFSTPLQFL